MLWLTVNLVKRMLGVIARLNSIGRDFSLGNAIVFQSSCGCISQQNDQVGTLEKTHRFLMLSML